MPYVSDCRASGRRTRGLDESVGRVWFCFEDWGAWSSRASILGQQPWSNFRCPYRDTTIFRSCYPALRTPGYSQRSLRDHFCTAQRELSGPRPICSSVGSSLLLSAAGEQVRADEWLQVAI